MPGEKIRDLPLNSSPSSSAFTYICDGIGGDGKVDKDGIISWIGLQEIDDRTSALEQVDFTLPPSPSTIANLAFFAEANAGLAIDGGAVTSWPDLSGNDRHATSPGIARSPILRTTGGPLGQAWLDFSAGGSAAQLGTPNWSRGSASTVFVVAKINTFGIAGDGVLIASAYDVGGLPMAVWQNPSTYDGNLFAHNGGVLQLVGLRMLAGQWALYEMVFSTTAGNFRINGDATWQTNGSTGTGFTPVGLSIGNRGPASNTAWRGGIAAVAVFDGVVSDNDRVKLRTYFAKKYLGHRQVIADGDSITEANPMTGDDWPSLANALMTRPSYVINSGTGGQKLSTMITNAPTQVDSKWNPDAVQKIVIISGGYNDGDQDGANAATIYGRIVTYCTGRRAADSEVKIIVGTLLPSTNIVDWEATRTAVNALIRSNYTTFANGVADIGADSIMGLAANAADTDWFSDGTHPTAAGRVRLAAIYAAAVNDLSPSGDVAARTLANKLETEAAARVAANTALASPQFSPVLPAWDTGANSGTLTGGAFSTIYSTTAGTLRLKGSRPVGESFAELFSFANSGGDAIGPVIYDGAGALQVRLRTAAGADIIAYNIATRSVPEFDLVVEWDTSTTIDRHKVWFNGVLQTAAAESTGNLATTQTQLRWGGSGLIVDHLAYYSSRLGTPFVLGSMAALPADALGSGGGTPEYANDAAADADTELLSGQFYRVTGSRIIYSKP